MQRASGIPCALCFERAGSFQQSSGAMRRGNAKLYQRHCEERLRRSNPSRGKEGKQEWIASLRSQ
jgi:hypothetical protein